MKYAQLIHTHINTHHVGRASIATPDADILRSVPTLYCRASESNDSGFLRLQKSDSGIPLERRTS
ncbi:hypothetical protein WNY98_03000 [Pseudoalteromonas sp. AS71]|uniref:hypothetical protein n=1 Tax=Pseudoalteromonas sp. AS71 TaxID=3135777 RepID=UPI003181ED17